MTISVSITVMAATEDFTVDGADERSACLRAGDILRAWTDRGFDVDFEVDCSCPDTRRRAARYLETVLSEAIAERFLPAMEPALFAAGSPRAAAPAMHNGAVSA